MRAADLTQRGRSLLDRVGGRNRVGPARHRAHPPNRIEDALSEAAERIAIAKRLPLYSAETAEFELEVAEKAIQLAIALAQDYRIDEAKLSSGHLLTPALEARLFVAEKQVAFALGFFHARQNDLAEERLDVAQAIVHTALALAWKYKVPTEDFAQRHPMTPVIAGRLLLANQVAEAARKFERRNPRVTDRWLGEADVIGSRALHVTEHYQVEPSTLPRLRIGWEPSKPPAESIADYQATRPGYRAQLERSGINPALLAGVALGTTAAVAAGTLAVHHPGNTTPAGPTPQPRSMVTATASPTPRPPTPADALDNKRDREEILRVAPKARAALDALQESGALSQVYGGKTAFDTIDHVAVGKLVGRLNQESRPQLVVDFANMLAFPERRVWQATGVGDCVGTALEEEILRAEKAMSGSLVDDLFTKAMAELPDGSARLYLLPEIFDPYDDLTVPVAALQYALQDRLYQLSFGPKMRFSADDGDRGAAEWALASLERSLNLGDVQAWDSTYTETATQIVDAIDKAPPGSLIFIALLIPGGGSHQFRLYKPKNDDGIYLLKNPWGPVALPGQRIRDPANVGAGYERQTGLEVADPKIGTQPIDRQELETRISGATGPDGLFRP